MSPIVKDLTDLPRVPDFWGENCLPKFRPGDTAYLSIRSTSLAEPPPKTRPLPLRHTLYVPVIVLKVYPPRTEVPGDKLLYQIRSRDLPHRNNRAYTVTEDLLRTRAEAFSETLSGEHLDHLKPEPPPKRPAPLNPNPKSPPPTHYPLPPPNPKSGTGPTP